MSDDDMEVDFGPLEIRFHPGKLFDLATVSLAAALLRYKITCVRRNGAKEASISALKLAHVSVPTCLGKTIDKLYCTVEKSWMSWWYYHHRHVFLKKPSHDSMIDWLDQMIWLPDGTINYEQTAKKILFCDKLTKPQKFQLACAYCFMDDVERLKAELTRTEIKDACSGHDQFTNKFSNYWFVRMKKFSRFSIFKLGLDEEISLLDKIPSFLSNASNHFTSLELYDEWSIIEYCFDQYSGWDRLGEVQEIVAKRSPRVIYNILVKLPAFELNSLINERGVDIIKAMVKKPNNEYTILIWKRVVHGIDNGDLADIINYVNNHESYERKYVNSLLLEMWLCTSERQKKFIINERVCDFIRKKSEPYEMEKFPLHFPLILDFLSHCDLERKYEYWSQNWPYLVIQQLGSENRSIIDDIMKLCIVDDQKIEDFKKTTMMNCNTIAEYFQWLVRVRRIKEIQHYLEFCTSDSQVIRDKKKAIMIEMPKDIIFKFLFRESDADWTRDLSQYLDDIFTETESKEFFNEIITYPDNLNLMCSSWMTSEMTSERLKNVLGVFEKYVTSEEDLFKVKQYVVTRWPNGSIKKSVLLDLMAWCLKADKHEVEKLKVFPSSIDGKSDENRDLKRKHNDMINEELNENIRNSGRYIYDVIIKPYRRSRYYAHHLPHRATYYFN